MYPSGEAGTCWLVSWSRMGFPFRRQRGKCVVLLQSDEEKGKGTLTVQGTKLVEKKLIIEVI